MQDSEAHSSFYRYKRGTNESEAAIFRTAVFKPLLDYIDP